MLTAEQARAYHRQETQTMNPAIVERVLADIFERIKKHASAGELTVSFDVSDNKYTYEIRYPQSLSETIALIWNDHRLPATLREADMSALTATLEDLGYVVKSKAPMFTFDITIVWV